MIPRPPRSTRTATLLPSTPLFRSPNRLDEEPGAAIHGNLAAVGVAFLLGAALLRTLRARGFFAGRDEPALIDLLDLVALGTVADVARPTGFTRAPVPQGPKEIGRASCRESVCSYVET